MDREYNREYALDKARQLASELSRNNIRILKMFLFGSFATNSGQSLDWSDIDIAIVSDDFTGTRFNDNLRIMPISLKVDPRIETHPFTLEDFEKSPFARDEIQNKGILIAV